MFSVVERRFERVSFNKSDEPATVCVAADGEGALRLSKCVDKVDLVLEECGSLDEDGHFVFCAGHDNKRQPVITWPVNPNSVVGVTAKVTPFTEAKKQIVLARLAKALRLMHFLKDWRLPSRSLGKTSLNSWMTVKAMQKSSWLLR